MRLASSIIGFELRVTDLQTVCYDKSDAPMYHIISLLADNEKSAWPTSGGKLFRTFTTRSKKK